MARYVAFLRGLNVGGHTVKMDALKRLFEELKLQDVETFIASGNVIFSAKSGLPKALEKKIAVHLEAKLGYGVDTFVRTIEKVHAINKHQPFGPAATAHGIYVGLVSEPLTAAQMEAVDQFTSDVDAFHCDKREVYWLCRIRSIDSNFSYKAFEKIIRGPATFRNLNTIARLASKYPL